MANRDEFGRSEFTPVYNLPEMVFEMPVDPDVKYGKAETPVTILPIQEVDLTDWRLLPALRITLEVRTDACPTEVALDIFRFYSAINQLALSEGAGLSVADHLCDTLPADGKVRVTFKPIESQGADERLHRLVNAIHSKTSVGQIAQRSIMGYEAKVVRAACKNNGANGENR